MRMSSTPTPGSPWATPLPRQRQSRYSRNTRSTTTSIIENPYKTTHYLTQYWCLPYTILDKDRTENGDYYKKPTQYWFINCKPKNNFIFEPFQLVETKKINKLGWVDNKTKEKRSMIHPQYANRFIKEHILESKGE